MTIINSSYLLGLQVWNLILHKYLQQPHSFLLIKLFLLNYIFSQGPAAVVLEVYKNGVIAKDNRIKVGDQIRDCNSVVINKDMTHERICLTIKLKVPKVKKILLCFIL